MNLHALQLDIEWEHREANHQKVIELIREKEATIEAGDIIVLPEMFDVGFSMDSKRIAQDTNLPSDQFIQKLSKDTECLVIAGVVTPLIDTRPANEALSATPNGELERYRKRYPFSPSGEQEHYLTGTQQTLYSWNDLAIAPFICYDLRFPEIFRPAAKDGAELIVVIANWPERRSEHWVRLLQARAIENQAYVLGVNRCGSDPALSYDGRSALFDPLGEPIFECDRTEQIKSAEIDPNKVREWRTTFPALKDAKI